VIAIILQMFAFQEENLYLTDRDYASLAEITIFLNQGQALHFP